MPRKQRFKPSRKPKQEQPPTQPETRDANAESELMGPQTTDDSQSAPPTSAE